MVAVVGERDESGVFRIWKFPTRRRFRRLYPVVLWTVIATVSMFGPTSRIAHAPHTETSWRLLMKQD